DEVLGRVAGRFARVDLRRRARAVVRGLLADLPRKNCWTIAEHAGDATPDGMQHLLARAVWDHDGVRDDVRAYLVEHLGDPEAVLVIDETGDLKSGTATVGVQRQYTGTAGRVANAQVAVYLVYATDAGHGLLDRGVCPAWVVARCPRAPAGSRRPRPGRVCHQAGAGHPDAGPRAGCRRPGSMGDRRRGLRRQSRAAGRARGPRGGLRAGGGPRPPRGRRRRHLPRRRAGRPGPGAGLAADL